MNKKYIKRCIALTNDEINHYKIPKTVSKKMIELAKLGFEPSGHGYSLLDQQEDWSMMLQINLQTYIHIELTYNKIYATIIYPGPTVDINFKSFNSLLTKIKETIKQHKPNKNIYD